MLRFALLFALAAACGGTPGPKYTGTVRVADTRLVPVNPDVKTFADADQPVFLARGSYWLFNDGKWFRSQGANGPWTYEEKPPVPVQQIDQPFAYVHFKHDQRGAEVETVARRPEPTESTTNDNERPARDRQPSATDPSVDPTLNLFVR